MSKEKINESLPQLSDFAFDNDLVSSAYNDIEKIYQTFIPRTNKHTYRYFCIFAAYLLNIACEMIKNKQMTNMPNLGEVLKYSQEILTCKPHVYPDGPGNVQKIIQSICTRYLETNLWKNLVKLIDKYDDRIFKTLVLTQPRTHGSNLDTYSPSTPTPQGLCKLALKILNIQNGDQVLDLGCGTAGFMLEMFKNNNLARYTKDTQDGVFAGGKYNGYEIATEEYEIAVLRANLLGADYIDRDIFNADVNSLFLNKTAIFDKIFADYPRSISYVYHFLDIDKASADWVFNDWISNHLSSTGKAVAIMSNGTAWNNLDAKIRETFIKNGNIEAVIALPEGLFNNTRTAATLMIFSHDNKQVRLVDATKCVTSDKPCNRLSDENIEQILTGLHQDTKYSKVIDIKNLEANDYVLNYGRYVAADIKFENGEKLGNLIKSIRRGVLCRNTCTSEKKTCTTVDVQYLTLSDIKNGIIDDELQYLEAACEDEQQRFTKKFERNPDLFVKENDLIISKSGEPYKIAVAHPRPGQKIIPSVNLYVIELDRTRVDPYYVKAFLESQRGKALLHSRSNHATMINISSEELQKIEIPLPPLEMQEKIKNMYLATVDEYKIYSNKMIDVINRLNSVFDDNCEELKCC